MFGCLVGPLEASCCCCCCVIATSESGARDKDGAGAAFQLKFHPPPIEAAACAVGAHLRGERQHYIQLSLLLFVRLVSSPHVIHFISFILGYFGSHFGLVWFVVVRK